MKDFKEMIALAKEVGPKIISVACAQDKEVLIAVENARKEGIANAILIGDTEKIKEIADRQAIDLSNYEIVDEKDIKAASLRAVELVSSGKADILMKGILDTSIILKAVLDKEVGLRTGNVLSHVGIFAVPGYDRLFFVTDAAMNIEVNVKIKKQIIENAVHAAHAIGVKEPKVALLCAKEKVNEKMPATVEAKVLEDMYKAGEFEGCIVGGPFGLDNAISEEAAKHKGINHPIAGKADILVASDIEAGNMLYKSMVFLGRAEGAAILIGTKAPVVLTSRVDSDATKLNSIALGVLIAAKKYEVH